ncbi:MAG: ABC transporter permease [Defluviitaleaceae bacterium]|nr:ABC transporter permease [Defluviitaleaceae bacterium]
MITNNTAVDEKPVGGGPSEATAKPRKKRSQMHDVWRRFKRSHTSMLGLFLILMLVVLALSADIIAPAEGRNPGYDIQDLRNTMQFPSWEHPMGTDNLGRDIFARIAHGARISLQVAFLVVTASAIIGVALGAVAGYYSGISDNIIMRLCDIVLAVPNILMAISIVAALGPSLNNAMIAVGIGAIPSYARVVRASVISLREQEFIEAAHAVGASNFRIITKHLLPNCMAPIIVNATMGVAGAILAVAALSFLGIGTQPPTPEWGAMLSDGRRFIRDFWPMVMFPGLMIAIAVFALNMMGDGLRDALDPRLKK